MNILKWLHKKDGDTFHPFVAELPQTGDDRIDYNSSTWRAIRKWASDELEIARKKNDSVRLEYHKTCVLRGQIKVLKALINLQNSAGNPTAILNRQMPVDRRGNE